MSLSETRPILFLTSSSSLTTSKPATLTSPEVGLASVVRTLMVVLLPAPFGPRKPKNSPFSTWNEIPSTAFTFP